MLPERMPPAEMVPEWLTIVPSAAMLDGIYLKAHRPAEGAQPGHRGMRCPRLLIGGFAPALCLANAML